MSSIRKLTKQEAAAYAATRAAVADVVTARLDRAPETEIARLTRRAAAHRAQWLNLASKLELTEHARDLQGVR